MNIPIVISAFGTTSKALETYNFIDEQLKSNFPDNDIIWSYSSRMVKDRLKKKKNIDLKHPHQVLDKLCKTGHKWAVVQSLHLMCGHEFYRLVEEADGCDIRTSIGLPLLYSPEDYDQVVTSICDTFPFLNNQNHDEALIMVGHGSDHHSWSSYLALNHMFQEKFGKKIWVGVVEDGYPLMESIVEDVKRSGFNKVKLMPFMLIAGVHFEEDLMGDDEDSWKSAFEAQNISVSFTPKGLGFDTGIIGIFKNHIQEALDIIPINS